MSAIPEEPDPADAGADIDADLVESLLARCIDAVDAGDRAQVERLLADQPEHADRVRRLLDSLDDMGLVETPEAQPFTQRLGDYRLLRKLGEGAMGVVYLARQESLQRVVAVKVMRPAFAAVGPGLERFRREATAIARLRHPNIVTVYDAGEHEGLLYFAMEWLPGRTLDEIPVHDVSIGQAVRWAEQIAAALECAHRNGIVHRDVKPSNIRIDEGGNAILLDFGIARDESAASMTATGSFQGSPSFAAPEQIAPRFGPIHGVTDVFSLGATLYSLLGGALPFSGETQEQIFHQVLTVDPVPLRRINGRVGVELETVVLHAMEKEQRARYASAGAMRADLQALLDGRAVSVRPPGPLLRIARWGRRRPAAALAVASLLGLLVTLAVALAVNISLADERQRAILDLEAERESRELDLAVLKSRDLVRRRDLLWPLVPERIPGPGGIDRWLEEARSLLAQQDSVDQRLAELREQELPRLPDDQAEVDGYLAQLEQARRQLDKADERMATLSARQQKSFAAVPQAWRARIDDLQQRFAWRHPPRFASEAQLERYRALAELREQLPLLRPLVDEIAARRDYAANVRERTVERHAARWAEVGERLRHDDRFAGFEQRPQVGLVPIGPDPATGLEEFAFPYSGDVPVRDAEDRLVFDGQSALVFVLLPGGTFWMGARDPDDEHPVGSANVDPGREQQWEGPVHEVTLRPFLLSKFEMTQGQYLRCVGDNPSGNAPGSRILGREVSLQHPVERVSWWDCRRLCNRLGLALPTEAQWEYAARAGTSTIWATGDDPQTLAGFANIADRFAKASGRTTWRCEDWLDDGHLVHAPVGSFGANAFALHDVHGNVYEWCRGWLASYDNRITDLDGTRHGFSLAYRIARSGTYADVASSQRVARRARFAADYVYVGLGFRPAWRMQ